jgi:hypothetical protein
MVPPRPRGPENRNQSQRRPGHHPSASRYQRTYCVPPRLASSPRREQSRLYSRRVSILVVHLVPEGMLFAADRNITATLPSRDGYLLRGQLQRPKVLKWPNRDAIVGYVGEGRIGDTPTDEWLYAFIGRNIEFSDYTTLGQTLGTELEAAMQAGDIAGPLTLHLGGFEQHDGQWTPRIWFIHNTAGLDDYGPIQGTAFVWSDEIANEPYYPDKTGDEIRDAVRANVAAGSLLSFSFRQGYDLGAFNAIDTGLRDAMQAIVHGHPLNLHPFPTSLDEWAKHLRMAVLGYSAYFGAFYAPYEQYVGGGADVVSAPWPT